MAKLIQRVRKFFSREPEKAPAELPPKDIYVGSLMFAVASDKETVTLFIGARPMSYSLGLMIDHPSTLCDVVRNMAYWMRRSYPDDRRLLDSIMSHGDVEPNKEVPFSPALNSSIDNQTMYSGEVSYFEAALMAHVAMKSYEYMLESNLATREFMSVNEFWMKIWNFLPDNVKMSVTYSETELVN